MVFTINEYKLSLCDSLSQLVKVASLNKKMQQIWSIVRQMFAECWSDSQAGGCEIKTHSPLVI